MPSPNLPPRLFEELEKIPLIDPHTHIDPHQPASNTLADIMGYHYYTELAHSAGLKKSSIEEPNLDPKDKVGRIVESLENLENTVQLSWLLEICKEFFDFEDESITKENWEKLYDTALAKMQSENWEDQILGISRLEQVFLTNDFDDSLEGFDTERYIPCLRTDELVFGFGKQEVRDRLSQISDTELRDVSSLQTALHSTFQHFVSHRAKACAISLPPDFAPQKPIISEIEPTLSKVFSNEGISQPESRSISNFLFWSLAECCDDFGLPFDLMIGVNRSVYEGGVFQGQDLFDQRMSLIQYAELFNAFPEVKFPVSVLAQASHQELVSFSWIFPNVFTHGHWWYSNIPAYIKQDCRSRLQAIPMNKQIGYYSDMYKLEFALPKFRMYRKILAKILAEDFVEGLRWSEERAIKLGERILRGNVETVFFDRHD